MVLFASVVDLSKPSLQIALAAVTFNPVAWNIVAQNGGLASCYCTYAHMFVYRPFHFPPLEYRNKTITRLFGGNPRNGCYFLAVMIFSFGIFRDSLCVSWPIKASLDANLCAMFLVRRYHRALENQPRKALLPEPFATLVPAFLFIVGQTFVITSTWALGITGTFLGDYFGILMDHRVEGYAHCTSSVIIVFSSLIRFPFNVLRDPMYVGSTMCFAAGALWYERPAGLLITLYVYIVYVIALRFEGSVLDILSSTLF